jgi:hypothetical protein
MAVSMAVAVIAVSVAVPVVAVAVAVPVVAVAVITVSVAVPVAAVAVPVSISSAVSVPVAIVAGKHLRGWVLTDPGAGIGQCGSMGRVGGDGAQDKAERAATDGERRRAA